MEALPESLQIPEATANACLPPEDLPVLKLIKFNLPPLHKSTAFLNPTNYLSEYAPTLTAFDPAAIPVPPHAVVKELERALLSNKDLCSIVLVHLPQHRDEVQRYPLWLATLWARMEHQEAAERAKQALTALADLGWTGNLQGLKAGGTISDLVFWFNKKWLQTDHEDGMLKILADDLGLSDGDGDTIWSTYFWLWGLGQGIAMGTRHCLGTVANKDDEHWVALAINSKNKTVPYGDRFRKKLFEHLAIEFRWTDLPIPEQCDSHSCAVLAYSALANFFEPAQFPLPESTADRTGGVQSGESKHEAEDDSHVGSEASSSDDEGPLPSDERHHAPFELFLPVSGLSDDDHPVPGNSRLDPSTPPSSKRTHLDRATDTPHVSTVKKKVKEKMEKRDRAEEHAKLERRAKAAKDAQRKESQNKRQRRHRAKRHAAEGDDNPRSRKEMKLKHRETAPRTEVAEGSPPARKVKAKLKAEIRKPSGRKQKKAKRPAAYVNWMTPFSWSAIRAAQRKVGWSGAAILAELRRVNFDFFQYLAESTVWGWIVSVGRFRQWKPEVLGRAERANIPGHNKGGRRGVLSAHPDIVEEITAQLADLRGAAWSLRKGMKAVQKLPADAEEQCENAFLRRAYSITEHRIPAELIVNADQTGVVYLPGARMTYVLRSSKQVAVIGNEEKCAFMVLLSISAVGDELPIQCMHLWIPNIPSS
ncbi:hypothetical protein K438DRAFT_1990565 [Mycena galopus ATCC 62051]|nr:hypothetical protein K438DRAFT_1990565 [Mycena galopus ATCC 62051]